MITLKQFWHKVVLEAMITIKPRHSHTHYCEIISKGRITSISLRGCENDVDGDDDDDDGNQGSQNLI